MNKRVLIISPNFPPNNSADLHRVRQMLPYLEENNWSAHVVTVKPEYIENLNLDSLLELSLPNNFTKSFVGSLPIKLTRRFGVGSLSIRTFFHYFLKVNSILKKDKFDLIFFSTTAFHLLALGPIWKKIYQVPFIVDIQDPWRSDYYLSKPKIERPPKFKFNYLIDKYLEKFTIPKSDGVLSVSNQYIETFKNRYVMKNVNFLVEPFSGVPKDFDFISNLQTDTCVSFENSKKNIVYVGRGGYDLAFALSTFFGAVKLLPNELTENIHIWFIGTSYAPKGQGKKTIEHLASQFGLENMVTEITDRIPYFESLRLLKKADLLFVPGSNDVGYTASKIYPYILAEKPLITIFHESSSVNSILEHCDIGHRFTFQKEFLDQKTINEISNSIMFLLYNNNLSTDHIKFVPYTDKEMTKRICKFFEETLEF
jgi:hypothetical protein